MQDTLVGIKSWEVRECSAATSLMEIHEAFERIALIKHEVLLQHCIYAQWTFLVYAGSWIDKLTEDLDAFVEELGGVFAAKRGVKLYKGGSMVVWRSLLISLYGTNLSAYDIKITLDQFDRKVSLSFGSYLWSCLTL